jgi:hypothetical protein
MRKIFCDRCGKEISEIDSRDVRFTFGAPFTSNFRSANLKICQDCNEELGLQKFLDKHEYSSSRDNSYADKLYDIFKDLVQHCLNESNVK